MRLSILTSAGTAVLLLASACSEGQTDNPRVGLISLTSQREPTSWGYAAFITRPTASGCTTSMIGGCEVWECVGERASARPPEDSAGAITVEGVRLDAGFVMTFTNAACGQNCSAYLAPPEILPRLWNGGETLTASATGDTVPAFSGKTVTAPSEITVTAPTCTGVGLPTTSCSLSRSADLTIAWTAGASTSVFAMLNSNSPNRLVSLHCRFASSPATISAEAMAKVGRNDDGYTNFLEIHGSNQTTFTAGSYDVTLEANNSEFGTFVTTSD